MVLKRAPKPSAPKPIRPKTDDPVVDELREMFQSRAWATLERVVLGEINRRRDKYEEAFRNQGERALGIELGMTVGMRYVITNVKKGLLDVIAQRDAESRQRREDKTEVEDVL